jgi:hypothetical protein
MTGQQGANEDALRAEIDQARTELGETVEALAAKTHVTARGKEAAARAAEEVKDAGDAALEDVKKVAAKTGRFAPFAFIGAVVAAVAGWRIWRRRSR